MSTPPGIWTLLARCYFSICLLWYSSVKKAKDGIHTYICSRIIGRNRVCMHLVTKTRHKKIVARASFFFHLAFLGGFFTAFCFQNGNDGIDGSAQYGLKSEKKSTINNV